jgi:hypothetical protein
LLGRRWSIKFQLDCVVTATAVFQPLSSCRFVTHSWSHLNLHFNTEHCNTFNKLHLFIWIRDTITTICKENKNWKINLNLFEFACFSGSSSLQARKQINTKYRNHNLCSLSVGCNRIRNREKIRKKNSKHKRWNSRCSIWENMQLKRKEEKTYREN